MSTKKINGFVISNNEIEDNKNVVKVFSKEKGKTIFYALGVNKPESKNKFSVQLFSYSEFELFESLKADGLSKLKTGVLKKDFNKITQSYELYLFTATFTSLLDILFDNNFPDNETFKLLLFYFSEIESAIDKAFQLFVLVIFKLLKNTGADWNLEECLICKRRNSKFVRFDFAKKQFICIRCFDKKQKHPDSFIKMLLAFKGENLYSAYFMPWNIEDLVVLNSTLINYYNNDLGISIPAFKEIKTSKYIKLNKEAMKKYL
ncbi:DNA repair protein RecO [Spiroplasma endosymbiont of Crioceris asparagi]|uniref:DNA repair protein RecO n=1 Tax=Spiroplasma endosymbiont of Crioceris asparagi TaxID=3066286 RepID=UPI0030CCFD56